MASLKLNTHQFVNRAIKVHKNTYDYKNTNYIRYDKFLTITCKIHGDFSQRAGHHLAGQGCWECGIASMSKKRKTWTLEEDEFIKLHYVKFGASFCAEKLNKTIDSVYPRAQMLGVRNFRKKLGHKHIPGKLWSNIIHSSNSRGLKVEITPDDIWNQFIKQNKKCALTGWDLDCNFDLKLNNISVDRIDSSKHYTPDNIQIIHKKLNQCKMDLTMEQLYLFCKSAYFNLKEMYNEKVVDSVKPPL